QHYGAAGPTDFASGRRGAEDRTGSRRAWGRRGRNAMRWSVFTAFAFVLIVVQVSVRNVFTLEQLRGLSPDLVACLVVFVSLFAHRSSVLWACWILGMLMDLAPSDRGLEYHLLGPHALGYVAGG